MSSQKSKFKKIVILDSVILYPEHRQALNQLADEIKEYPSSLPENLEKQYEDQPEMFKDKKCYTQLGTDNTPAQLLMNRIEGADVVISCWTNIPDEVLALNPQLKVIIFWTHEKEHRINVALAEQMGITVANIPDYGTDAVAEVVFAGLWESLKKNYSQSDSVSDEKVSSAIMNAIFTKFRKLPNNEKYTRSGKFSHHFHKLGLIDFTFTKNKVEDLIPERLLEGKSIGLLNLEINSLESDLKAFGCRVTALHITDDTLADFYKAATVNDVLIYNSSHLKPASLNKLKRLFPHKLIDVNELTPIDYEFKNKIFGVVGLGRIGTKVAKIAKNLGFLVIYYSKTRKPELENTLGIAYASLDELAKISDIISIHLPAHKAENLVSADVIKNFKSKSIFINTADGNAVDQAALTERLLKNEVFAYLDVYPGLPRKDILGLSMADKTDWKIKEVLSKNVFAYRAGWKTQESINVKTYKLLGILTDCIC